MGSIRKNIILQTCYQILIIIIPLVTAPYISRVIGADGIGIYSYTYSVVTYFVLFAKLGIHIYGNRTIASVRDNKEELNRIFSELIFVHVIWALLIAILYVGYISIFVKEYKLIAIIQTIYILAEVLDINWLYIGLEKIRITVTRNTLIKIFTLPAIFIFVNSKNDVWVYCAILAVSIWASEGVVWFLLPRYVKFVRINIKNAIRHYKPLIAFFIPSIAVSLYKVMDKIMLGYMTSSVQLGFYENSEKIINVVLTVITAFGTVLMPRMTNLLSNGENEKYKTILSKSINLMVMIVIPVAFGVSGISKVFMPLFFGEEFSECYNLVMGLAISMPFVAVANIIRTQVLIPKHRDKLFQGSVILGAVVNIIFNSFFIPSLKSLGAVIGTILAEITVFLVQLFGVRKELPIKKYIFKVIPYVLFGGLMFICVYYIGLLGNNNFITLLVQIISGGFIYGVLLIGYLYVKKDVMWYELKALIGSLKRSR